MLKFNTYLFALMSALLLCSFSGLIWWQVYGCVNTLLSCGNFILWIDIGITGANRLNDAGSKCALNETVYNEATGASWASDAATIKTLFIV